MAIVKLTPIKAKLNSASTEATSASLFTAVDASAGAYFEHKRSDAKYIVLARNADASTAKTLTVKKGNGLQGIADYAVSIAAGKTVALSLESGAFKNVSGTDDGRVIFTGTDAKIEICVLEAY